MSNSFLPRQLFFSKDRLLPIKRNFENILRNQIIARILATTWLQINEMKTRRDVFQAIADPTRRDILSLISKKALTPNALAEHFDSSRQAVSKHIKILSECELIKQEHSGREIYYYLNPKKLKELDKWLQPFRAMWEDRFNQLDLVLKNIKNNKL